MRLKKPAGAQGNSEDGALGFSSGEAHWRRNRGAREWDQGFERMAGRGSCSAGGAAMSEPISTGFPGRDRLLGLLVEVSEAVAANVVDLDRQLRSVAELIRKVVDYEIFAALLTVQGQRTLLIRYAAGLPESVVRTARIPFGQGITGTAASERRTIVSNDVSRDPRYIRALDAVRSEMAVPMIARGETVGVLDLQSTRLNAFTAYERQMIELIASRISLAVDSARLFAQTSRQAETLRTLLRLSDEFSTILSMDELMAAIAHVTRKLIDYDAYTIFLLDAGRNELRRHASFRYDGRPLLETIPLDIGAAGQAARTRRPVWFSGSPGDTHSTEEAIRSEVALPMLLRDRLIGVLYLESERPDYFTQEHVEALSMLASQLAAAIENARLHEQVARDAVQLKNDLAAARRIQRELLLPSCPNFPGLEIAARNRPVLAVSGDFYDFYPFPERGTGELVATLGDVAGKGAAAALFGALTSGLLRSLVRFQQSPGELLQVVNRALAERQSDPLIFAAVACVGWNPAERILTVSNSGLPFPLLWRRGDVTPVKVEGLPLGMFGGAQYEQHSLNVEPGDILAVASDGLLDAEDPSEEPYGPERLAAAITRSAGKSAGQVIDGILSDIAGHCAGASVTDDQTLLVLKIS